MIILNQHPLFPLIILSNRDEFYQRSSSPADYWIEHPYIFSGRDLQEGGTWLGVNRSGHFSLITNYRNPVEHRSSMKSRGRLVANYLIECKQYLPEEYLNKIKLEAQQYNNFNLLVGSMDQIYFYSNVENKVKKLSSGIYGLSNHLLDTPWHKVNRAKELINNLNEQFITSNTSEQIIELFFPILSDTHPSPEHLLPQTGVEHSLEQLLSPIFITIPEHHYGTNQSTMVIFERDKITFAEKKFQYDTLLVSKIIHSIPIDSK
ncbi:NRDE family protein [uncultured Legionella sp.]|uniref:NRDE family protein n=1 Tax=uncultured Legionella sp. TaxID=210934 RepID=UPI00260F3946|nr:NRDE family protein [uncultured Legionella sp.]